MNYKRAKMLRAKWRELEQAPQVQEQPKAEKQEETKAKKPKKK